MHNFLQRIFTLVSMYVSIFAESFLSKETMDVSSWNVGQDWTTTSLLKNN